MAMNTIAALQAGRAAELLVIGEAPAGDGDLARAIALAVERRLGFSTHQPLLCRPPGGQ